MQVDHVPFPIVGSQQRQTVSGQPAGRSSLFSQQATQLLLLRLDELQQQVADLARGWRGRCPGTGKDTSRRADAL